MSQQKLKTFLEKYANEIENRVERKIHHRIGNYKGEYYDGEYITIQGGLFLTTHDGNLFTVYDKKQDITDYFDIFESNSVIEIDERFFPYVIKDIDDMKNVYTYIISLVQIETDIKTLNNDFIAFSGAWEYAQGDASECTPIAKQELELVKAISSRYPFKYVYIPSDFDENSEYYSDEWYASDIFTIDDFNNNNVTEDNYGKADIIAFNFKEELIGMLDQLKTELEWLPPRFRQEFIEMLDYGGNQDRNTIRKNCEFFSDEIMNELTEEEKARMFIQL